MLGPRQEAQAALFFGFSLEDHIQQDYLLRSIDLSSIRAHPADFYTQKRPNSGYEGVRVRIAHNILRGRQYISINRVSYCGRHDIHGKFDFFTTDCVGEMLANLYHI